MPLNEGLIFDLEVDFGRFSSAFERVFGLVMKLGLATGFLLGILRVFSDRMAAPTEVFFLLCAISLDPTLTPLSLSSLILTSTGLGYCLID